MAPKIILNPALFTRIISQARSKFELIKIDLNNLDPDNLPDRVDAQLGLEQLKEIYDEAIANLKPFSTAPESVESFREEEMFPLSDRLYAEYYAITKYLRRAVSAVDSKPSTTSEPGIRHPTPFDLSIANIPKLEVTPFDGDFRSFDAFYASFTSIIHENAILSNTQKLQYLINALDKQTKNIIAHLPLQDASYQRALDLLKARFSNPLRAVTAHTDSILKLPNLDNPTAKSLRHFIDTHNLNFNTLCNLTPNNVSETVYSALILSKLSPQLKSQLHKSRDSTSLPSVTEIFHFLTEEAVHKETVALYSTATSSGTSSQSRASPSKNPVFTLITSAPSSRAVLDSASQASFVSEAAVNSLKIKRDHSAIPISGIGLSDSQSSGLSHISVASLSGAVVSTNHPFLVLPVITRVASSFPPSPEFTAALKNVVLADPSFNSAAPIDCLLGASIFPTILTGAPRSLGPSLPYAVPTLFGDVLMGPAPLTPLSCNVACVSLLASAEHNPVLRNAPAYPVESHDPGPAAILFLSGDRDSVDHSPDSRDPPIKMLHRSLEVEKTPPTKVLQLPLGSASEEFSLKPNEQTSKPPDELLETAPESPGIPLITTPESYSLNSISSWPRRFRVAATILARRSRNRSKPHSTRSCVWHAEIAVCQHIQQSRFAPQLNQTRAGKPLSKSWARLSPLISDDGLIRAGGRLCLHSPSCPILLPNDHPLVLALTDYLYVFFSQAGPLLFYFNLSGLWIFFARRVIKSRLHKCVTSYRAKSINHPHLLGDLPSSLVTAYPSLNSHFRVASGPGWHRTESFDKDRYGHISKPSLSSQP
ncbi:hypothetical protein AAG570_005210 [Ranatra chinensis]|uniref:Uncharacterized protein n=1 Tax=Ranatra chinensis TaxID=642074 RepID=A0ABD0Y031_9HEMI